MTKGGVTSVRRTVPSSTAVAITITIPGCEPKENLQINQVPFH